MYSIEFLYWLQGFFEVCENSKISKKQYLIIKNHLKMVQITEGIKMLPFCHWLSGIIDIIDKDELNENQTNIIKNKLNNIFDHVVQLNVQSNKNNYE